MFGKKSYQKKIDALHLEAEDRVQRLRVEFNAAAEKTDVIDRYLALNTLQEKISRQRDMLHNSMDIAFNTAKTVNHFLGYYGGAIAASFAAFAGAAHIFGVGNVDSLTDSFSDWMGIGTIGVTLSGLPVSFAMINNVENKRDQAPKDMKPSFQLFEDLANELHSVQKDICENNISLFMKSPRYDELIAADPSLKDIFLQHSRKTEQNRHAKRAANNGKGFQL